MALKLRAFISFQTEDRAVAGDLKKRLDAVGIQCFLAHEDIDVLEEWRSRLLQELSLVDIFICVLSERYLQSQWCVQECGIAAFRKDLTIIPLSIDGTIPQGFIGNIQSARIDPENVALRDLVPAFLKRDFSHGIDLAIALIGSSSSFRMAEANFSLVMPYIAKLTPNQAESLLQHCVDNGQIEHASLCAKSYIPELIKLYPHALPAAAMKSLRDTCRRYGGDA
jgi:hypothetical protein